MQRQTQRAVQIVGAIAATLAAAVTGSGTWLARYYRPGERVVADDGSFTLRQGGGWTHDLHVWSAWGFAGTIVVHLGLRLRAAGRIRIPSALTTVTVLVAVVLARWAAGRYGSSSTTAPGT